MQKQYYSAESLDLGIRELEREYGMSTEEFYERYTAGENLPIPQFSQHTWAAFHEDILRLTDGEGVERPPVMERVGQALVCS